MEFRLVYRGPLKSKGSPKDKQAIRRVIHPQLRELWNRSPLRDYSAYLGSPSHPAQTISLLTPLKPFQFIPLVSSKLHLVAELDILFLRPDEPGRLLSQGGDIDNRLKTLLDALRMPKTKSELGNASPTDDEEPFHCLLEDDSLVTKVALTTDRPLEPSNTNDVLLLIHVRARATRAIYGNEGLSL
jgi:hypothetical protein